MKYLREEVLKGRKGEPISLPSPEGNKVLTTGLFVFLSMDAYVPMQNFQLRASDMRLYNRILNKLEGDTKEGFWEFEDAEFNILSQCVENMAPFIPALAKYTDAMDDALKAVKDKMGG